MIQYVGVNDHSVDLFEGQFVVPNGMAYNSYLIRDNKIAVTDTVSREFVDEWLNNLRTALDGAAPDYLIVHHMEPDHSAGIAAFAKAYPEAVIVATDKAFSMMHGFFCDDYVTRRLVVKDGDTLSLGDGTLTFYTAPMVHWPEVMLSYYDRDRALFSADAFGKFGARDTDEDWACEARRYYFGIVGKYGGPVQTLLKKLGGVDIAVIHPLHGPSLDEDLGYYLNLYNVWSSYGVESEGVCICYTSVYGNTAEAARLLADELNALGCPKVALNDLARCDMAEAVEDAFRYGKLVLATTTYNGGIFPFMHTFVEALTERGYQNRHISLIENGSWAPTAAKTITKMFENSKNITFGDTVTIHSALTDDNRTAIKQMAHRLL